MNDRQKMEVIDLGIMESRIGERKDGEWTLGWVQSRRSHQRATARSLQAAGYELRVHRFTCHGRRYGSLTAVRG
jgi:hypothetical protein